MTQQFWGQEIESFPLSSPSPFPSPSFFVWQSRLNISSVIELSLEQANRFGNHLGWES